MAYNPNPYPQQGQGAFGLVPGAIGLPSPASDLAAQYPNLSGTNQAVSGTILGQLGGNISSGTLKALQNAAATFGVQSGMPGSGLQWNNLFGNIAGFAENQAQRGLENYGRIIPTVSQTQTLNPALQAEIASQNALYGAAPNPQAAQSYAQGLFNQYLAGLRGAPQPQGPAAPVAPAPSFAPDRAYPSLATTEYYGGVPLSAPPTGTGVIPTGNAGRGFGTGTDFTGSAADLGVDAASIANMTDEQLVNYISSGGATTEASD